MKLLLCTIALVFSATSFAAVLSPSCEQSILKGLRDRSIERTGQALSDFDYIEPVVGAVCKQKEAFTVDLLANNKAKVTAYVNPWAGAGNKLRVTCNEMPLNSYPVNVVNIDLDNCDLKLTHINFEFNLDD